MRASLLNVEVTRGIVSTSICQEAFDQAMEGDADAFGAAAYFERLGDGSQRLCRLERFTETLPVSAQLLVEATTAAENSLGSSQIVLMKEKLNIKWPSGGGYRCHQDSRAYPPDIGPVLSVGIALTPCDEERGGVFFANGVNRLLPSDEKGCVGEADASSLDFFCPQLEVGDAVLFSGFVPHYSGANTSPDPRALALFTYVLRPDGDSDQDVRESYRWREAAIQASGGTRLSTIDDFSGVLIEQ